MSAKARPVVPRLMAMVAVDADTGCWVWTGYLNPNGYARISVGGGRPLYAHRVAYELFVGPIPAGLTIDHLCRNRACVNPSHLEPVTQRVNTLRGDSIVAFHASKTHCTHGHEFTVENTITEQGRYRRCRTCRELREARRRAA